jgi:hypothetical protein
MKTDFSKATARPWVYELKPDIRRIALARQLGLNDSGLTYCELRTIATRDHTPKLHGPTYLGIIYEEAAANLIVTSANAFDTAQKLAEAVLETDDGEPCTWCGYPNPDEPLQKHREKCALGKAQALARDFQKAGDK